MRSLRYFCNIIIILFYVLHRNNGARHPILNCLKEFWPCLDQIQTRFIRLNSHRSVITDLPLIYTVFLFRFQQTTDFGYRSVYFFVRRCTDLSKMFIPQNRSIVASPKEIACKPITKTIFDGKLNFIIFSVAERNTDYHRTKDISDGCVCLSLSFSVFYF